jgi:hypothetical protein
VILNYNNDVRPEEKLAEKERDYTKDLIYLNKCKKELLWGELRAGPAGDAQKKLRKGSDKNKAGSRARRSVYRAKNGVPSRPFDPSYQVTVPTKDEAGV